MTVTLPIKVREKKKVSDITSNIPGVVYGPKQTPLAVVVERKQFEKLFKSAGESTVIELTGLPTPVSVLVKDVTFSPIKGGITHIDFYALEKGKELVTDVPLHFVGEAPVMKLGAVINKVLHEVTVACQAENLPAHLDVDITTLTELEGRILVKDILCPKGVRITSGLEEVVAVAEAVEEEAETETVAIDMDAIAVEQKGKTEDVNTAAAK